jgi:DNA modification methylase
MLSPYYESAGIRLYHGDCREILPSIQSADACITDPPYGLEFMNNGWDAKTPSAEYWRVAYGAMKSGANLFSFGGTRTHHKTMCAVEDAGFEIRDCMMWLYGQGFPKSLNVGGGWGTALKPAWEPIIVAMKPLDGTFAENAQKWGVAGLNVDGCRVPYEEGGDSASNPLLRKKRGCKMKQGVGDGTTSYNPRTKDSEMNINPLGRWPSNVLLDEGSRQLLEAQSVGASRFFYCPKPSKDERGAENDHPTVKPISLMQYLCLLCKTPSGGHVVDPFCGSGTTLVAAKITGLAATGIELDERYCEIAAKRLETHRS